MTTEFPSVSQTFIADHITSMIERGHKVTVLSLTSRDQSVQDDLGAEVTVRYVRDIATVGLFFSGLVRSRLNLRWLLRHLRTIRRQNASQMIKQIAIDVALSSPDFHNSNVVHVHFGPLARMVANARRAGIFSSPLVATFHGYDATQIIKKMPSGYYQLLFEEAVMLHAVSDRIREKLVDAGASLEKIRVRRVGLPKDFSIATTPTKINPEKGHLSRPALHIVSVGRFVEKKGFEYAISSLHLLAAMRPDISFSYEIIGAGALNDRLRDLASSGPASKRVKFSGSQPRSNVIASMRSADILLQPSVTASNGDEEGIPVVIMEAMKLGTPVLSTHHAGIPELVEHRFSGYLVAERDAYSLFKAISQLSDDPESRAEFAQNASHRVSKLHDAQKNSIELERDYFELIDTAKTALAPTEDT